LNQSEKFLRKIDENKEEHESVMREEAQIKRRLREMSRDRGSIERGEKTGRIGRFNKEYVSGLARLSRLRQTHNDTPRELIAEEVKKWKERN
jgi:hypothetical protein